MRRGVLIAMMMAGMLAAPAILSAQPAQPDPLAQFQAIQKQIKAQQQMQERMCPPIDPKRLSMPASDLFTLHVENGMLVLRTTLPSFGNNPMRRVKIGDQPDWAMVTIQGNEAGKGASVIPPFFTLTRTSFAPERTESLCVQQVGSLTLNISLQEQTPTRSRVVQLQEQFANIQARNPSTCQLVIMEMTRGRPWSPTVWNSHDFTDLTLEHPLEVDRYLRPLLGQLDQENALTPDAMLAFEVFGDRWPADAAITAKVNALVAALGTGDFRSRARAANALQALGKDSALVLIHLDRAKLNPEQCARIDMLLAPYHPVPPSDAAKLRSNPMFLADCLYSSDLTVRQSAFAALVSLTKLPLNFDPTAEVATRAAQVSALTKQLAAANASPKKP